MAKSEQDIHSLSGSRMSSSSLRKASITDDEKVSDRGGIENAEENAPEAQYVTGFPLYTIVGGLTMAAFLLMLDTTIVTTSIPKITDQFDSVKDIGWYGSAYTLSVCSLQMLFGKIYQVFNKKYSFMSAMALFEFGSLICAVSVSSKMFIIGRAIAGCGASGIYNGALTIITMSAPLSARPALLGVAMGISNIGLAIGPLIGGALTEKVTWRWCFYLNLPLGALTIAAIAFIHIPSASPSGPKIPLKSKLNQIDIPGAALFIPSVVMLLLALNWGGTTYAWSSATIIGLFVGSFFQFIIFLLWEAHRKEKGILPLAIARKPIVLYSFTTQMFSQGAFFLLVTYLPTWFQVVKGISPLSSGVHTLPTILSQIISTLATGFSLTKTGYATPFALAGASLAAIACGLMSTFTPASSSGAWIGYQVMSGAARGFITQVPITTMQAALPHAEIPIGTSLVTTSMTLGAAIFVSLGQTTLLNELRPALAKYAPGVDATRIIEVGATAFREVVSPGEVESVVRAYNKAITTIFYLAAGASCVSFATSWGLGWKNLKARKDEKKDQKKEGEQV